MTAIGVNGDWRDEACFVADAGAAWRADEPEIDLGRPLAAREGWALGTRPMPGVAAALEVERFEEEPERWDGLS